MASTPPDWDVLPPRRRPRTLWGDLAGLWSRIRALPGIAKLILFAIALLVFIAVVSIPFRSGPENTVATRSTTTVRARTIPPLANTTTTLRIPVGEDKLVSTVVDGDSFEIDDGTKVRLIGIDAPDTEKSACFSGEAMTHLRELLPSGRRVRIAYDTTRTDTLGRTLAYVYRLPDGLFVNMAMARDGYAVDLATGADNTAHTSEIESAVADARAANRGLWQACSTTGSSTPGTTTEPATPGTTSAPATTTTEATSTSSVPTTTTPSTVPSTTTAPSTTTTKVPGPIVTEGTLCLIPGATAYFSNGTPAVCASSNTGLPTWRAA